jgi:purine-binding chemotaxis protein CheW
VEALRAAQAPGLATDSAPSAAASVPVLELFGSFLLGADEFALPAIHIREVVNFPERMTSVPLAPYYLEGMFTLRGSVIPVVNLARLFQPDAPAGVSTHKIAIVEHQDVLVGMLVHAIGNVLRVRPEQRASLQYAPGQSGVVEGTILLDQGRRLIQVLDVERLIRIENVPQVLALRGPASEQRQRHLRAVGERRRAISFRSAGAHFALDMKAIQEIVRVPELQSSVLNSKLCLGRMHFRGSQVAVVDFATLAGAAATASGASADTSDERRVLIARIDGATIGFLVDAVESIVHFATEDVMPIPLLSKTRSTMFAGCVARPEQDDVILLDHAGIFSSAEVGELQQGIRNLFPEEGKGEAVSKSTGRKVYLNFSVGDQYALELKQVREIIDCCGDISLAPGMPDYVRGILNLRQTLVTLVDLRRLYNMPPAELAEPAKVLVIDCGEERFGLIVDSVNDIVTVDDAKRYATPSLMRKSGDAGMQAESSEVLELAGDHSVCLLDPERLLARLA